MTNAKVLTKKLLSCLLCLCLVLPLFSSAFVPLAAELKDVLTVDSSAASTTDLTTVNYTNGGYHYYYYQNGATFVSSIDARSKPQGSTTNLAQDIKNAGNYYPNDVDLNNDAGGHYIKFGFKMTDAPAQAFTKMAISTGEGQGDIGTKKQWPAYYRFQTSGPTYTVTWEQSHDMDLNKKAGGAYLYFCHTRDTRVGKPLTFIYAEEHDNAASNPQYARYLGNAQYADLNQEAGGKYIYLVQEDGEQNNRRCHDGHAYVNTSGTTDVSEAVQLLQNTYNQYNNYLVDDRYTTATYNALNTALNNAKNAIDDYADYYSNYYTKSMMSSYQQAIINAANALATNVYFDAGTNGGTTNATSDTIVVGTNDTGSYQYAPQKQASKSGWSFSGWALDQNAKTCSTSYIVGYNTTLYAIFSKTVTFNFTYLSSNGAVRPDPKPLTFYNAQTSGSITTPSGVATITKNGGTFNMLGYRADTQATNVVELQRNAKHTVNAADVNGSYQYYAIYERNDHTLAFDNNGGEGAPNALTATQYLNVGNTITENTFTIPSTVPTREGYDFQGWGIARNGAAQYQPGQTITLVNDQTLYAIWEKATYTITFDTNGGSEIANKRYKTDLTDYLNETPTKTGYTFKTWIAKNVTGNWVDGNSYNEGTPLKGMMGNVTLAAEWTPNNDTPYIVRHMKQNTDGTDYVLHFAEPLMGTTDATVNLAGLAKTLNGLSFKCAMVNGVEATEATIAPDGSLIIEIFYDRASVTVKAKAEDGIESIEGAGTYLYGDEVTLTAKVKDGYFFSGWTGSHTGTDVTLTFIVTGDVDVTANAKLQTYYVSYNAVGGTLKGDYTNSYTIDQVITLPKPVRDGYDFTGWKYEQDGTGINNWKAGDLTATATTVGPNLYGDVILYATWKTKDYTITFDTDGGEAIEKIKYTVESTDLLPSPSKSGYMPQEWIAVEAEGDWIKDAKYSIGSSVNGKFGNVTLKAVYSQMPYTLSFDAAGGTVTPSSVIYDVAGTVKYPADGEAVLPTPVRPGYSFGKWVCVEAWPDGNDEHEACDWVVDKEYDAGTTLVGVSGNAKFTATWTANKYDVTVTDSAAIFNGTTGADVITAGNDYTATVSAPAGYKLAENINVKIGERNAVYGKDYSFTSEDGFVTATLNIKGNAIADDITITPLVKVTDYTITYIGVNQGHGFPATYNITSGEIVIGKPSRNGYRFTGWTGTGIDGSANTITIPAGSTGNLEFTAKWVKEYTVTFETAGGNNIEPFKYIDGEDVIVPVPTKEGYKFLYWTATEGWTDEQLPSGTLSERTGNATLTAVYSPATSYNVEEYYMDTNGEYSTPETTVVGNVFVGDSVSAAHGTREGFTPDVDASTLSGTVLADGELTLKLYYTRNQYNVNVNADANVKAVEGVGKHYYGEAVTLKAIPNGGYRIVGWTGDYTSDEAVIGFTVGTSDVNLNVTSEYIIYTIEFAADGLDDVPETIVYNPTDTVTLPEFAKVGYDMFWYVAANEGAWKQGNMRPGEYSNMHGNVILTAVWVPHTNTPYVVKEYFQNIENDEYAAPVVKNLTGTTDTKVASPEIYEGFTAPAASELVIAGDGSTLVEYFYTRNSYTVTYSVNGIVDFVTYKYAQDIVKPEDPAVNGYKFNGWDNEIPSTMPAENLAYTADMSLITYTVTFSGAIGDAIAPITYNVTEPLVLPNVTEPGYTVSWILAADSGSWKAGGYAPNIYPAGNYGDLTLKADNSPITYTAYTERIILQNVDSTYAEAVEVERYGTTGEVVAAPEEKAGFITPPASKLTIKGDGSRVVTYTYDRCIYSVTFDVMGEETVAEYCYEADIVAPADPEIAGYTFLGWNEPIAEKMPANDLTYTAQFEANEYTITFDANGGSAVDAVTYTIEDDVTLPVPVREGLYFDGWKVVTADGNWDVDTVIEEAFTGKYGNISLQAVWTGKKADYVIETYYMTLDGTYAEQADSTQTLESLVGEEVSYEMPVVEGFTADTAKSVLTSEVADDGSTVLKAYYSRNKYTVNTALEGNGTITESADYYYGAPVEIKVNVADHYIVDAWTGVDASGNIASFTMPAEDLAIKAVVVPIVYTCSFDGVVTRYTVEDDITVPAVSKDGYTVNTWVIKAADGNWKNSELTIGDVLSGKYGNVEIVSDLTATIYTLAYDVNGGEMPESYYYPAGNYIVDNKIVLPVPTKTGYRFLGWEVTAEGESNWPEQTDHNATDIGNGHYGNVTLKAVWSALDVKVYVEHYLQNISDDEFTLIDKYDDYHKADSDINIAEDVAKSEPNAYHFEKAYANGEDTPVETVHVNADGTTTIKLYYLRDLHSVTVEYKTPDGVTAPETYVGSFRYGQIYNIKSPSVAGYKPSPVTVSGRIGFEDVEATVTYDLSVFELTVNYYYENGSKAADPNKQKFIYGDAYSVDSPVIEGYTPSVAVVEGTMGDGDMSVDVIYAINTHTLTINYICTDGTPAAEPYVAELAFGYEYIVKSSQVYGYTTEQPYVVGIMPDEDVTVNVVYAPNVYTVIFRDFDGTDLSVQRVEHGKAATAPADPVRANDETYSYTFKGWSVDFSEITDDTVITAQYISTNLSTGDVEDDDDDNSILSRLKAFIKRLIKFLKVLFTIT